MAGKSITNRNVVFQMSTEKGFLYTLRIAENIAINIDYSLLKRAVDIFTVIHSLRKGEGNDSDEC